MGGERTQNIHRKPQKLLERCELEPRKPQDGKERGKLLYATPASTHPDVHKLDMTKAIRQTRTLAKTLAGHSIFNDDLLRALHKDTITCDRLEKEREKL
jgi:hypothetical protein